MVNAVRRHYVRFFTADLETRIFLIKRRYFPVILGVLLFPLRLLIAALLRITLLALRPIVHIRFGPHLSNSIGAWAIPTELYLCERDAGLVPKRTFDVFYNFDRSGFALKNPPKASEQACNTQFQAMVKRRLLVNQVAGTLDKLNRMLPIGSADFTIPVGNIFDSTGILDRFPPHLTLTEEEERRGVEGLREIGIGPNSNFVCFYARDGTYTFQEPRNSRMVSLFGDWDVQEWRNASIGNYLHAADELSELGYYAVRMGKFVKDPLDHENPSVIDYASKYHSDFMDVYLSARCAFFIGQNGGMIHLPAIFRRPMALVNISPFSEIHTAGYPDTVFIPKKYYSAEKGRLLSFREILADPRLYHCLTDLTDGYPEFYKEVGLAITENTPEEIAGLATEMHQRLDGTYSPSQEDEELQQRFQNIITLHPEAFPPCDTLHKFKIGSSFLRTHPELLG